jgi:hypothetical protein
VAIIGRLFGSTVATGAGFAFGHATSPVLAPAIEELRQQAWSTYQTRIPSAAELAAGVAEGKVADGTARNWAHHNGFGDTSFDAMVAIAKTAPDVAMAMQAWRRGELTKGQFETVLQRHGIDGAWYQAVEALKASLLSPGELAAAIHRGLVPDAGLLLGEQPTAPFKVEAYPVENIDALTEAAGAGFDRERLQVLVGLQGLPMGAHEAAQAYFRNIITHGDYIRAFNTSNLRNEWAQAILDQTRQIPTARDFFENALRGYHDLAWAQEQAQRHGMSEADSLVIYQNQGRPMNLHAITQGLARGGKFKPEPGEITDPYMASIVEGNLKPAYYDLAFAARYTLPTAFAIRQLAQSGVWDEAKVALRLKQLGWLPEDADEVAKAWSGAGGIAKPDSHVGKAQTQLWTATHRSYIIDKITRAQADTALSHIIPDAGVRGTVLDTWDVERTVTVKPLTPSQIKKAYAANVITIDDAIARLEEQGREEADARLYLTT